MLTFLDQFVTPFFVYQSADKVFRFIDCLPVRSFQMSTCCVSCGASPSSTRGTPNETSIPILRKTSAEVEIGVLTMELEVLAARNAQLHTRLAAAESMVRPKEGCSSSDEQAQEQHDRSTSIAHGQYVMDRVDAWCDPEPLTLSEGEKLQLVGHIITPLIDAMSAMSERLHALLESCGVTQPALDKLEQLSGSSSSESCENGQMERFVSIFRTVSTLIEHVDCSVRSKTAAFMSCIADQEQQIERLHRESAERRESYEERARVLEAACEALRSHEARMTSELLEARASTSLIYEESKRAHVSAQAAEATCRELQAQLTAMRHACLREKKQNVVLEKLLSKFRVKCIEDAEASGRLGELLQDPQDDEEDAAARLRRVYSSILPDKTARAPTTQQQQSNSSTRVLTSEPVLDGAASPSIVLKSPLPSRADDMMTGSSPAPVADKVDHVQQKVMMLARQIYRRATSSSPRLTSTAVQ